MNQISQNSRNQIADELGLMSSSYSGKLDEPNFLSRLFDLHQMPSRDPRYNNAYDEIYKHMVMNRDWNGNWVFTDTRFNLMHCDDTTYLNFLTETLHPVVVTDDKARNELLELYNRVLGLDGYELLPTREIQGQPIYTGVEKVLGNSHLTNTKQEVKKLLSSAYIDQKITVMNDAVETNPPLAIGTAKELVETVCKSILKQKGVTVDKDWEVAKLLKETTNSLDFKPKDAHEPDKAEKSVKQILGGISSAIQGVTELRNAYG
ncbi:MAG: hypothetical protein EOO61_20730, partial [Hymenobacter sp.]